MTPVTLKFSCHVKERGKEDVVKISSLPTNPIIVITNESQWGEAAGKLLQAEAFGPTLVWGISGVFVFRKYVS